MPDAIVTDHLRSRRQAIVDAWCDDAVRLGRLDRLDRSALVDHLPEFLDALLDWMDGDRDAARRAFDALAEGHAIQRLGYFVPLDVLTAEYGVLRRVVLTELRALPTSDAVREPVDRLNLALDEAVYESVRRYTARRDQVRERFIGILGHDLRSPLSSITMAAQVLTSSPDGEARGIAALAGRAAARMSRLIDAVTDFTRANLGGGMPVALKPADMAEMCTAAVDEIRIAHPARTIRLQIAGDLRGQWDRDRVMQALTNLLTNAITHGESTVTVRAIEEEDRAAIVTSVTNGGPPLPPEQIDAIFDPFQKPKPRGRGLGLGLFIVREIALAHGALCTVASAADSGTTFTIRWPRTPASEVPHR